MVNCCRLWHKLNYMKKKIIILIIISIIVVIIGYLFIKSPKNPFSPTLPQPNLDSTNQTVPDFGNNSYFQTLSESSDGAFDILYLPKEDRYLISIYHSPFATNQKLAEKAFLDNLKIDPTQACKLKVVVSTPYFANPDESGQEFPLSFCP